MVKMTEKMVEMGVAMGELPGLTAIGFGRR
jgi:hypothetical protein